MKSKLFLIIFITLTFFLCGLLCFQKNEQIQTKKLENENVLFSLFQGEEKVNNSFFIPLFVLKCYQR